MMHFFTDPILRAPTIGCMLMSLICALIGVIVFTRKESMLGETLSHTTYPGMMLASLFVALLGSTRYAFWGLVGSVCSCIISLYVLRFVRTKIKMSSDSALCFVLTLFFGIGLALSSYLQTFNSQAYKQARVFLFGQAATITDSDLTLYLLFALAIVLFLVLAYKPIQLTLFDPLFAQTVGLRTSLISAMCYLMLISAIVIGIRSIGILLLSGMLIGPAIAARQWTDRLNRMFLVAGFIGAFCGFMGVFVSSSVAAQSHNMLSLATGPTILLVSASLALLSLFFAPKRGWVIRSLRILKFRAKCNEENILKSLWHLQQKETSGALSDEVFTHQSLLRFHYFCLLIYLDFKGDLMRMRQHLVLTQKGKERAERIVRMHRLWELYLVHIGVGKDRVHHNAEEMEHIITEPIEKELLKLMDHPTKDPHDQPIPGGLVC